MINYKAEAKHEAQLTNIEAWRKITGRKSLYAKEQYWTFIDSESFEIDTIESAGFLRSRRQFVGVNYDPYICKNYSKKYGVRTIDLPWDLAVLKERPCPNGGLIYLDTMDELDGEKNRRASTLLNCTMRAAGKGTLICANFCFNRPRVSSKPLPLDVFVDNVRLPKGWSLVPSPAGHDFNLPPRTNRTQMVTFFFWKAKR